MSDTDVQALINLAAHRSARASSAKDRTPLDALRDAIDMIERGEIAPTMLAIVMRAPAPGGANYPLIAAGTNDIELVGLLAQHLHFRSTP
jgi:hypothetical protein